MERIKEEGLSSFQSVNRGRLSPESGRYFLFGVFIYTSIFMWLMFYAISKGGRSIFLTPFEEIVALVEIVLYTFQCVLLFPNFFIRSAFKFQKIQALAIVFSSFQLATLPFLFILVEGVFEVPSSSHAVFYIGILILGAILTHIVSVKWAFREAAEGKYSPAGIPFGLFNKKYSLPIALVAISALIIIWILAASSIYFDSNGMVFLAIQTVILYGMAIGSVDFVLLAYCRFKFPSFNRSWEDYKREREKFLVYSKREEEKRLKRENQKKT